MALIESTRRQLAGLSDLLIRSHQARQAFYRRQPLVAHPRRVQIHIAGRQMIRLLDAESGRVLAYRQNYADARIAARQLERGEYQGPSSGEDAGMHHLTTLNLPCTKPITRARCTCRRMSGQLIRSRCWPAGGSAGFMPARIAHTTARPPEDNRARRRSATSPG